MRIVWKSCAATAHRVRPPGGGRRRRARRPAAAARPVADARQARALADALVRVEQRLGALGGDLVELRREHRVCRRRRVATKLAGLLGRDVAVGLGGEQRRGCVVVEPAGALGRARERERAATPRRSARRSSSPRLRDHVEADADEQQRSFASRPLACASRRRARATPSSCGSSAVSSDVARRAPRRAGGCARGT